MYIRNSHVHMKVFRCTYEIHVYISDVHTKFTCTYEIVCTFQMYIRSLYVHFRCTYNIHMYTYESRMYIENYLCTFIAL